MKWINHKIITSSIAFILTQNVVFTLGAYVGSTLPDRLEWHKNKESINFHTHRQVTHWLIPYVIALLILSIFVSVIEPVSTISRWCYKWILGLICGCIGHILEDAITGTVPGIRLHDRIGKQYFLTGSVQEYGLSIITLALAIVSCIVHGITTILQGDFI